MGSLASGCAVQDGAGGGDDATRGGLISSSSVSELITRLDALQRENEAMRREHAVMRREHGVAFRQLEEREVKMQGKLDRLCTWMAESETDERGPVEARVRVQTRDLAMDRGDSSNAPQADIKHCAGCVGINIS